MLIKFSLKTSRLNKIAFFAASRESRGPLFGSGNKGECNYSCTIIFVLDPWLLDEASLI